MTVVLDHQDPFGAMQRWIRAAVALDPAYELVERAFEFGARYHVGVRKDGVTPEYHHQIGIGFAIIPHLKSLLYPVETLAVVFLHDVEEDYHVGLVLLRAQFGPRVADEVDRLSKVADGVKKSRRVYVKGVMGSAISSVVKGFDREYNMKDMLDVFSMVKIGDYTDQVEEDFFPMLDGARALFPEQSEAYDVLTAKLRACVKNARASLAEHWFRRQGQRARRFRSTCSSLRWALAH